MFVVVAVVIGAVSDLMRRDQDRMIEDMAKTAFRSDIRERGETLAGLKSRLISVAGVKKLKERGDIPGLVRAVGNKDHGVQYEAVEALGDLRDPSAIPTLIGALTGDQYSGIRWKAVEALTKIGSDSVPSLVEVLKNPDPDIRWKAAVALGEIGDHRGISPLVDLLGDSDRFVRSRAAYALVHIGPPAVPSLTEALNHPDASVRLGAVGALGKIGDPQAISALVDALGDRSPDVRQEAISALSSQGERAIPLLSERLHDPDRFIRRRAVLALAGMRDEAVLPILLKSLATADPDTAEVLIAVIEERQAREPGKYDGDQDTANLLEMFNLT
jgi:HEAT repeat protein